MIIEGRVIPGMKLARKLGIPTINITNDLKIQPSIYIVSHNLLGTATAFVLRDYCEVHVHAFPYGVEPAEGDAFSLKIEQDVLAHVNHIPKRGTLFALLVKGFLEERREVI